MNIASYYGTLEASLPLLKAQQWSLLGSVSTEDRCIGAALDLKGQKRLAHASMIQVRDIREGDRHTALRAKHARRFKKEIPGGKVFPLHSIALALKDMRRLYLEVTEGFSQSIALDISTMPKAYFFPILKWTLEDNRFTDVLVLYTKALRYTSDMLASDVGAWMPIQPFSESDDGDVNLLVVAAGFMPFNLPELVKEEYGRIEVKYLFPVPPGPPTYQRTWNFMNSISDSRTITRENIVQVSAHDAYGTFKVLERLCANLNPVLAPYGSKPVSLGMALYAMKSKCSAYYTQPSYYHPDYSSGIGETVLYPIKVEGVSLYWS